jgi:aryl-alcohol dehydrogenase-like predicted oxidoreductase
MLASRNRDNAIFCLAQGQERRYRKFGRTGIEVSDIAPGLWGMGGCGSEGKQSLNALQLSVGLGCNFFDTAWAYGEGKSDGLLGQIIANKKGKRLFVASKIPPCL